MPLSEREERILAEIERRLAEEDPRFVRRPRRSMFAGAVWRLRAAVLLGLTGVVLVALLTFDPALGALGLSDDEARSSLRFGLLRTTTEAEVDYLVERLVAVVGALRRQR